MTHIIAGGRYGGAETFFVDLVDALAKRGVDQHAFTRPYADRLQRLTAASCSVSTARMGGPLDLLSGLKLRSALRKSRPSIVMAWMSRAAHLMRRGPWINVGRLGGYYDLKYYKRCDVLVCNTPALVEHCIENGWSPDRITYIPNFSPKVNVAPVSKASLSTPDDAPVALILARLEESKGIDTALRALANVPDLVLWVAGVGPQEKSLAALAQSLNVHTRVRFLGWRHDREALLRAADVCLVPSRLEPFGNVVLNAWRNSVPVVASTASGPSFLITHDENGLLVDIDDYHGMATSIRRILQDSAMGQRLLIGGESKAETEFSEQAVTDSYLDLFGRLTDSHLN